MANYQKDEIGRLKVVEVKNMFKDWKTESECHK